MVAAKFYQTTGGNPGMGDVSISFFRVYTDAPMSPHQVLPRIKARLYFGHAVQDQSTPPEAIDKLNQALAAWGGRCQSEIYEAAHHGWTVPDSPAYNQPQAERAFAKLTQLFADDLH